MTAAVRKLPGSKMGVPGVVSRGVNASVQVIRAHRLQVTTAFVPLGAMKESGERSCIVLSIIEKLQWPARLAI